MKIYAYLLLHNLIDAYFNFKSGSNKLTKRPCLSNFAEIYLFCKQNKSSITQAMKQKNKIKTNYRK